jgi:hypothetical protein
MLVVGDDEHEMWSTVGVADGVLVCIMVRIYVLYI